jgi:hypothetical protein
MTFFISLAILNYRREATQGREKNRKMVRLLRRFTLELVFVHPFCLKQSPKRENGV